MFFIVHYMYISNKSHLN